MSRVRVVWSGRVACVIGSERAVVAELRALRLRPIDRREERYLRQQAKRCEVVHVLAVPAAKGGEG